MGEPRAMESSDGEVVTLESSPRQAEPALMWAPILTHEGAEVIMASWLAQTEEACRLRYGSIPDPTRLRFANVLVSEASGDVRDKIMALIHPLLDTGDSRTAEGWAINVYLAMYGCDFNTTQEPQK